jgi:hypothetical protein
MSATAARYYTTSQAAEVLGVPAWRLRRLFLRKLAPEPGRFGIFRLIPEDELPRLRAALAGAGFLPPVDPERGDAGGAGGGRRGNYGGGPDGVA